jgi:predicted amidohydrolase
MENTAPTIAIRLATENDDRTLLRLAALDSAPAPHGSVLVADIDGEIVAAHSLAKDRSIADPFRSTADVRELLELRARQAA